MNFISHVFLVFLLVVFLLWRFLPQEKSKLVLLVASLIFYAYWYPPFILLLVLSGAIGYFGSLKIDSNPEHGKMWLFLAISGFLSILFFFKYCNFFLTSVSYFFSLMGMDVSPLYINTILPLGISFYTFQGMSYVIDVYTKKIEVCKNPLDFFTYNTFFPQLVAGPIVRAVDFIPQMKERRLPDENDLRFFVYRMTRGFFLKVVVANNVAMVANNIFNRPVDSLSSTEAWSGALLFSLQIFCDFAGYSDIAIGTARLFGYRLDENFNNPYIAEGFADFWRRWHISLSTWFRDYLYIPLGGNRVNRARVHFNIMVVFILSGIWHGANWTFVAWGTLHGLLLLLERYARESRLTSWFFTNKFFKPALIAFTFISVVATWVPFRSKSIAYCFHYWGAMFSFSPGGASGLNAGSAFVLVLFILYQTLQFLKGTGSIAVGPRRMQLEAIVYFTLTLILPGNSTDFVYFQF